MILVFSPLLLCVVARRLFVGFGFVFGVSSSVRVCARACAVPVLVQGGSTLCAVRSLASVPSTFVVERDISRWRPSQSFS